MLAATQRVAGGPAILTASPQTVRPVSEPPAESWREELKGAIRDPAELCRILRLAPELASAAAAADFPLIVPRTYVARMRVGDPHDPLLRQVLPMGDELVEAAGFVPDPVDDAAATRTPGLLQKYAGRALLVVTGACPVHCRYCFRRHFPYDRVPIDSAAWDEPLAHIAADNSIHEVILSGGDPLSLVDQRLAMLVQRIAGISHVRRLRVHTRFPIVIPQRVTTELMEWLTATRLMPIVVLHANHAQELTADVPAALARLRTAGVSLLNQAVLLGGVNDSCAAQAALCERLVDLGVMPYYLHLLDHVAGAAHFDVPETNGRRIVEQLRERLPGYAVPRFVQETPGAVSKTSLT